MLEYYPVQSDEYCSVVLNLGSTRLLLQSTCLQRLVPIARERVNCVDHSRARKIEEKPNGSTEPDINLSNFICKMWIEDEILMAHETTSLTTAGFPEVNTCRSPMCGSRQITVANLYTMHDDEIQGTTVLWSGHKKARHCS